MKVIIKYGSILGIIVLGLFLTINFSEQYGDNDILYAIGSGVFGSAFVTLIIEILADYRNYREFKKQREFIFSDIKSDIMCVLKLELLNFAQYYYIYSGKTIKTREKEPVEKVLKDLIEYSEKILKLFIADRNEKNKVDTIEKNIVDKWILKENNKDNFLCLNVLPYYEHICKNLSKIEENKDIYISMHRLTEDEYYTIKMFNCTFQQIVSFSQAKAKNYIIDIKKELFRSLQNNFSLFNVVNIDKNQEIDAFCVRENDVEISKLGTLISIFQKSDGSFNRLIPNKSGIYKILIKEENKKNLRFVKHHDIRGNDLPFKRNSKFNDVNLIEQKYKKVDSNILYIGKANSLRKRIAQYLNMALGLKGGHEGGIDIFSIERFDELLYITWFPLKENSKYSNAKEWEGEELFNFYKEYNSYPLANWKGPDKKILKKIGLIDN